MFEFLLLFLRGLFAGFQSHSGLVLENLALRHQLAVVKRRARKPKLRSADRLLWVGLRRIWPRWQQDLLLFNPKPSSPGIALAFAFSGAGNPELAQEDPPSMVSSSR